MKTFFLQVLGWYFIGMCSVFAFMVAAFVGGSIVSENYSAPVNFFFNASFLGVPFLCVVCGFFMTFAHFKKWRFVYRLLFVPPVLIGLWFLIVVVLVKN